MHPQADDLPASAGFAQIRRRSADIPGMSIRLRPGRGLDHAARAAEQVRAAEPAAPAPERAAAAPDPPAAAPLQAAPPPGQAAAAPDRGVEQVLLGLADGSYVLSTPDGVVGECGSGAVGLLGASAEKLVGRPAAEVLVTGSDERAREAFARLLADGGGAAAGGAVRGGSDARALSLTVVAVPLALGWEFTSLLRELGSRDADSWTGEALRVRHARALEAIEGVLRDGRQPEPGARLAGILIVLGDVAGPPLTREDVDRRMAQRRAAARAAAAEAERRELEARRSQSAAQPAGARQPRAVEPLDGLEGLVEQARVLRARLEEAEREAAAARGERDEAQGELAQAAARRATEAAQAADGRIQQLTTERDEAGAQLEQARGELTRQLADLQAARTELEVRGRSLAQARAELQEVRAELGRSRSELAAAVAAAETFRAEREQATARAQLLALESDRARAAAEAIRAEFSGDAGPGRPGSPSQPVGPELPQVAAGRAAALIGLDGCFKRLDDAFCSLLGCPEEKLRAARWPSVIDRENLQPHQELARALKAGEIQSAEVETVYMHAQGLLVPIAGTVSMFRSDPGGEPTHFLFEADVSRTAGV